MKNTTFRKKALLSSVAMLLVALVALGSATFAWFTANDTVTATGLAVKSSAADGLKIAKTDFGAATAPAASAYKQTVTINDQNGEVWSPVSPILADGEFAMYQGSSDSLESGALNADGATSTTAGYYAYDLWLKAENGAATITVTADFTGSDAEALGYARAALIDDAGNAFYLSNAVDSFNKLEDPNSDGIATSSATAQASAKTQAMTATTTITAGTRYHLYVWFEGQDSDCVDANANADLALNLSFTKS